MSQKADPHGKTSGTRWRPNWAVWRHWIIHSVPIWAIALSSLFLPEKPWHLRWLTPVCPLVGGLPVIVACYLEWKQRPPAPYFWIIEGDVKLTVRSYATGETLLQSAQDNLVGRDLRDAWLPEANLRRVDLSDVDLRGAILRRARLRGARLWRANLAEADLRGADLSGASIGAAKFQNADLRGAKFRSSGLGLLIWEAELGGADFTGARYNRFTRWPAGFDPEARGCLFCEEVEAALPIPARQDPSQEESRALPLPSRTGHPEPEQAELRRREH